METIDWASLFKAPSKSTSAHVPESIARGTPSGAIVKIPDIRQHGAMVAGKNDCKNEALMGLIASLFYGKLSVGSEPPINLTNVKTTMIGYRSQVSEINRQLASLDEFIRADEVQMRLLKSQLRDHLTRGKASDTIMLVISIVIWVMLACYLYVFYVNAGYNAFVYQPASNRLALTGNLLMTAIINPSAFRYAFHSDAKWFLLTYPFVFLGLGVLIHEFTKKRQHVLIASLLLVTLLFDGLLAFEIVRKIYEVRYLLGSVSSPWADNMALHDMTFYLILFAGFIVYVVWGLLTSAWMQQLDALRPGGHAVGIKDLERDLAEHSSKRTSLLTERTAIENSLQALSGAFDHFRAMAHGVLLGFQQTITTYWGSEPHEHEMRSAAAQKTHDDTVKALLNGVQGLA